MRDDLAQDPTLGHLTKAGTPLYPLLRQMLDLWVLGKLQAGLLINGDIIQGRWTWFATRSGIPLDKLPTSNGWLQSFTKRHQITMQARHGEAASSSPIDIENKQIQMKPLLEGWLLDDIYNEDETGLFYG